MVNFDRVAKKLFSILKGYGYQIKMFGLDGSEVIDPEEARRFYVDEPNMMLTLDDTSEEIILNKNSDVPLDVYEDVLKRLRLVASQNMLNFTLKDFGKKVEPKDFSYQAKNYKEATMENVEEAKDPEKEWKKEGAWSKQMKKQDKDFDKARKAKAAMASKTKESFEQAKFALAESLSKMFGSTKTSRQTLENVQILVRHRKPVQEEIRGSRTRNIQAIFLEANGERFRFPHNSLSGARAMARHLTMGGSVADQIGEQIVSNTGTMMKLKEFLRYARSNNLINEGSNDAVELVRENVNSIQETLKKLSGIKTYESAKLRMEETQVQILEGECEDTDKYRDMFTVKRFDEKFMDILPLVSSMVTENTKFLERIEEAAGTQIAISEMFSDMAGIIFEKETARLGNQIASLGRTIKENSELSSYVVKLGNKIVSEQALTEFEKSVLSKVLENCTVALQEETADALTESFKSFESKIIKFENIFESDVLSDIEVGSVVLIRGADGKTIKRTVSDFNPDEVNDDGSRGAIHYYSPIDGDEYVANISSVIKIVR
jgi:hypothetical protein